MKARDLAPAAGVFLVALAYLLLLRPYGFQLEDEGTLLFWFDRVTRGQQPYVDFHTGYTPGFFALGKAVFTLFGPSATALRGVLAVLNAATAAALAEVARRVAGRSLAWIAPLVWLAFMPVYVGEFATFNVPYPTWPVTFAWVLVALAMTSWIEKPRHALLALCGAAAAFAMAMRPNSGAFVLAAATWIVVAASSRPSMFDRACAWAASAFMAAGVFYTFQFDVSGIDALVHLLPTLLVAVLFAGPLARAVARPGAPSVSNSLAVLGAAFVVPTLAWTLPLLLTLGVDRFLHEVFLVGADVQSIYHNAHPSFEPYAALVIVLALATAAAGRAVAKGVVAPLAVAGAGSVAVVGACVVLMRTGVAPEGVLFSIVAQLENASFWLAVTANYGALAWLLGVAPGGFARDARARAMLVVVPLAVAMYLQLYPRNDFAHQIAAVPLSAVLACGLLPYGLVVVVAWSLAGVLEWIARGARDRPRRRGGRGSDGLRDENPGARRELVDA